MDGREGKAKVSGTVSLGAGAGPNKGLELTAFSSSSGLAFGGRGSLQAMSIFAV